MGMTYVKVFVTFLDDMDRLSYEERGRLFTAMLRYGKSSEDTDLPGLEAILWPNAKRLIDEEVRNYKDKCRKARQNAKKGVEKRKKAAATEKKQRSLANASQEQEHEKEQEHEQEYEQEYCETVVSQIPAPAGAHERDTRDFSFEGYGQPLCDALTAWLRYKDERGQPYRRTGFTALKSQIRDAVSRYGEAAVADVIHSSMAANYHCITLDRLAKQKPSPTAAHKRPAEEEDQGLLEYQRMVAEELRRMDGGG